MGRYVASIGKVNVQYGDWVWNYIKQNQPKAYYETSVIDAEIYGLGEDKQVKIPVEELVDVVKNRTTFSWEWSKEKTLHTWLYNYLENISYVMEGSVSTISYSDAPKFYLKSPLQTGGEVLLSSEKYHHVIHSYEDFQWMSKMGLRLDY